MEKEEITLNLNADAVKIVLSLIQHSLLNGGAIQLGDLNTINSFANACMDFLKEVERRENEPVEEAETIDVKDAE